MKTASKGKHVGLQKPGLKAAVGPLTIRPPRLFPHPSGCVTRPSVGGLHPRLPSRSPFFACEWFLSNNVRILIFRVLWEVKLSDGSNRWEESPLFSLCKYNPFLSQKRDSIRKPLFRSLPGLLAHRKFADRLSLEL